MRWVQRSLFLSEVEGRENGFKKDDLNPGDAGNIEVKPRDPMLNALKLCGTHSERSVRVSVGVA